MFRSRLQVRPIGIDIGRDGAKMVQLATSDGSFDKLSAGPSDKLSAGILVIAADRRCFSPEKRVDPAARLAALPALIHQMLIRGNFVRRRAVVSLPSDIFEVRTLRLPPTPAGDLPEMVRREARASLPFPLEKSEFRVILAPRISPQDAGTDAIVFAAPRSEVDNYLDCLDEAGVAVAAIELETNAAYRSLRRGATCDDGSLAILDIGASRSRMVIGHRRQPSFVKMIEIGGERLNEAVARKIGISVEDAQRLRSRLEQPCDSAEPVNKAICDATRGPLEELAEEVARCLRYYTVKFRGSFLEEIVLAGGEAASLHVRSVLNACLPVPVNLERFFDGIDRSGLRRSDRDGESGQWAVALGLALRTIEDDPQAEDHAVALTNPAQSDTPQRPMCLTQVAPPTLRTPAGQPA